ncbi:asparagine synthase (glutamine-hydrolyzing) [uncultured Roseobacter sp.]|uniref:asparagine synthase (glutamine-hydrolyzing) n=1 Tax=uncultured Roseobacter sp. TaxID=114847 RepID=UPI002608BCFC|nr:asparagine synthase (glutamine-hydrolyzing) [uncultured Roseobacter sp.]
MCGITGYLWTAGAGPAPDPTIEAMMSAIAHRGPDSQGHWSDTEAGIAFGHLRLAIVDLTPAGHQPMQAASGRYVLTFNGEIYNHQDLRVELEAAGKAPPWRGNSDTETLLAGIDAWGLQETLTRCVGMFAFALWDRKTRTLSLARDRMGEKPLYYGWQGRGEARSFLFGSELKALRAHPAFEGEIAPASLVEVLRHGHVAEDRSIYAGIAKVRPGQIVTLNAQTREMETGLYWDGAAVAAAAKPARMSDVQAVDRLEALLLDAVGQQMMSDVPLGAFLSGGIDSSTVVALMQKLSDTPVHTFSIGFHEARYDEADFARAVAAHLGTHHTDLYVSDQDLRDVIPLLPQMYDEPFADSSQIPTYLVSKLARAHVTVSLSGDGGDELFCGYGRYAHAAKLRAKLAAIPQPLRSLGGTAIRGLPARGLTALLSGLIPTPQGKEPIGQRLHRLANYAKQPDLETLHRTMVSVWRFPEAAVPGATQAPSMLAEALPPRGGLGDIERMMQLDMLTYMVDDILAKVDRATMAVALESRAPLLDHRVVEFAWALPEDMKLRGDQTKWALRQVLYRHVPPELIERPKMGFEVPIGLWLRGGLKDWAAALLDPTRLRREGYFDAALIGRMWQEHLSERFNWGPQLWCVLMVQAWLETLPEKKSG